MRRGEEIKRCLCGDKLSFALLMTAAGMILVYSFIKNPLEHTLSNIGTQYPFLFFTVSMVMSFAVAVNIIRLLDFLSIKSKPLNMITYLSNGAMLVASVTMTAEYVRGITEIHWICAIMFIALNPIIILICDIKQIRKGNKKCLAALFAFLPIYIFDLIYIVFKFFTYGLEYGKNGVMELVPIFSTLTLLFVFNHTKLLCENR